MVIIFALALADRINILSIEKKKAQDEALAVQEEFLYTQKKWSLELENKVNIRTQELQQTLAELRNTQDMLIQSEKMSSLGNLVAGVAHEINTPIGVAVTLTSYLEEKNKEMKKMYEDKQLKKTELEKYINTADENSKAILFNLHRVSELIKSFKNVAVDRSIETKRSINLVNYFNEVILNLKPNINKNMYELEVFGPLDLEIYSYPGAMAQIINNLIMNSLIHAFSGEQRGKMHFNIEQNKNIIKIMYTDNGKGMPRDIIEKVFEPFFTTNRKDGSTGLGMHIVYNLVTQTLNGRIQCDSKIGEGIIYIIEFPDTRV